MIAAQLNLHFPGGKCAAWKNRQKINRFSSNIHQYDRTVSGHLMHVTDDLENVAQGDTTTKIIILKARIFLKKNVQCQIADGNW